MSVERKEQKRVRGCGLMSLLSGERGLKAKGRLFIEL
jgi:hypothetical protein